jgi:hypothetical protein
VRRAAVVGVAGPNEHDDDSGAEPPAAAAPERRSPQGATPKNRPASAKTAPADRAAAASAETGAAQSEANTDESPAASQESRTRPRVRRLRIDQERFDPARTGATDPREVIDTRPIGTHISLERSYTELAIDRPLRPKYELARSLADAALARVDGRAKLILAALYEAGFLLAPQIGRLFRPGVPTTATSSAPLPAWPTSGSSSASASSPPKAAPTRSSTSSPRAASSTRRRKARHTAR